MRLEGKRIMMTAAGQGMGRAAALACLDEGAEVFASDLSADAIGALEKDAQGRAGRLHSEVIDVTSAEALNAYIASLPDLDGLFNVAGFVHHGTIMDIADEDWAFSFDLNVTSMMRAIRAALPGMLRRAEAVGSVSILNMASMASSIKGFPNRTAYGASKAAVIGLTKAVAVDYVTRGIRVNALCPGTVDTPSLRGRIAAAADPVQAEKDFIARQPMGKIVAVEDVTPMITYLLSDESRFVTGQEMLVDGGATL